MRDTDHPHRSVLYIPGSNARALDKARGLPADAIIFDLEDAVAASEKDAARDLLARELKAGGYGRRKRIVRINHPGCDWGRADIVAAVAAAPDAILMPKCEGGAPLDALAATAGTIPLWAMVETPAGVLDAARIAAHPGIAALVMGTNDLAKDLRCGAVPDRMPLLAALQTAVLAARAHGKLCIDGVYNAFRDQDGLRAECEQGRLLGFDGKTLIHPGQIAVANAVFAPSAQEVELARRQIDAFDAAQAAGQGVAVLDGRIVENLHVETARATLARADTIREMEEGEG